MTATSWDASRTPAPAQLPGTGRDGHVLRFDRVTRALHWTNAALFLVLLATGMTLYLGPLSGLIGRRVLVKDIHVISGLLLPLPLILAYAGPWRAGLRGDVRRLARWSSEDKRWLRSFGRRARAGVGKFNAGQKLNAAFVAGCIPVMLATGAIMRWYSPFPLSWRTGATFVHDWLALALLAMIVGHIAKALAEPAALKAMLRGTMPETHVAARNPRWHAELQRDPDSASDSSGS